MTYAEGRQIFNQAFDGFFLFFVRKLRGFIEETGNVFIFGYQSIAIAFKPPFRWSELIIHMEFIGNKSVQIIALSGVFTGMALSLQIYLGFKMVNATTLVGPTVALGVFRELGPVLTGLIVAARAGGAMAARLGSMRVTEQIDALEVMGVNPIQYLVSPRIIAAILVLPLLCAVYDFVAMAGCWAIAVKMLGVDNATFWFRTESWLKPYHIFEGLFKAAIFGLFFAVICTRRGFFTKGGAEGVGAATNEGVVTSMVLIIVLDFFVTNAITAFYSLKAAL